MAKPIVTPRFIPGLLIPIPLPEPEPIDTAETREAFAQIWQQIAGAEPEVCDGR